MANILDNNIFARFFAARRTNPDVYIDFELENQQFFLSLVNLSNAPARNVKVRFSAPVSGKFGQINLADLPLFKNLDHLSPLKKIAVHIDQIDLFFENQSALNIAFKVSYENNNGRSFNKRFDYDLKVYKDLSIHSSSKIL